MPKIYNRKLSTRRRRLKAAWAATSLSSTAALCLLAACSQTPVPAQTSSENQIPLTPVPSVPTQTQEAVLSSTPPQLTDTTPAPAEATTNPTVTALLSTLEPGKNYDPDCDEMIAGTIRAEIAKHLAILSNPKCRNQNNLSHLSNH